MFIKYHALKQSSPRCFHQVLALMAFIGRKPIRQIVVAALLLAAVCFIHARRQELSKNSRSSLQRDVGAQLMAELTAGESSTYGKNDGSGADVKTLTPEQACSAYFAALYAADPRWWNDYRENAASSSSSDTFQDYETERLSLIMERMRVYEACQALNALPVQIADLDARMFPFIRPGSTPSFVSGDLGKKYDNGVVPILSGGPQDTFKFQFDPAHSFLDNWKRLSQRSSGTTSRGIVLSFPDSHVSMAIRLLKVLEHQKNQLPIQVVHKGDLSFESQQQISQALPKGQNLWFVNVKTMLDERFASDFHTYRNKWLAVLFNTFHELVFIDADAVSILPMNSYFAFEEYKKTGTLFFQDRAFAHKFDFSYCVPELKALQPTPFETKHFDRTMPIDAQLMLSMDSTTEQSIIQSLFVGQQRHHMDSGLLAVDKSKHMSALLAGVFLNLAPKLSRCAHGDKEFLWLAFLLTNHEYKFHPTAASAIGRADESNEICSVQLGHTSTDGSLLWFNSGFRFCKFSDGADYDWDAYKKDELRSRFSSIDAAREFYKSMVNIESAVIPDPSINPWGGGFADLCIGYTYCAKTSAGAGEIVHFPAYAQERINAIGKVWMDATEAGLPFFSP
ncbi:LAME_0D07074g1_1 [Lachancea meyersii CBS 8951]|uniref:LAME_0D07074g1_1 n=1 Tax=Lachancea meyersii CBS 8951 TaxID=1266667 RepID=A0A1G4J9J4_9SACH|nr:LAME_0D07074g1_1 [Lachancea meyersii CBS 8951]